MLLRLGMLLRLCLSPLLLLWLGMLLRLRLGPLLLLWLGMLLRLRLGPRLLLWLGMLLRLRLGPLLLLWLGMLLRLRLGPLLLLWLGMLLRLVLGPLLLLWLGMLLRLRLGPLLLLWLGMLLRLGLGPLLLLWLCMLLRLRLGPLLLWPLLGTSASRNHWSDGSACRDGLRRCKFSRTPLIDGGKLLAVLCGRPLILQLRGHGRNALLTQGGGFGRQRLTSDASRPVVAGAVNRGVVDGAVIHVNVGDVHIVDGAVIVETISIPVAALIPGASVAVSIVNAAVVADILSPKAIVVAIEASEKSPRGVSISLRYPQWVVVSGPVCRCGPDDRLVSCWLHGDSLLDKTVEQLSPAVRLAPVEPEGKLVQIAIQMLDAHRSLMCAQ